MNYGYRVVYGDPQQLTDAGYGLVAHLPAIFDSRPGYHRLASRFLIDRGLGEWDPVSRGSLPVPTPYPPSTKSMKTFADRLANFLEWCDVRGLDPLTLDYSLQVIGRYQKEMMLGLWARDAVKLAPRTINARVDVACEYLTWAADKGLRDMFFVPKTIRRVKTGNATSSVGHLGKQVGARSGKIRQPKRRLHFPSGDEVLAHLQRVYDRAGLARGLMVETILGTAIRREEAACWRVDTLPLERTDWHIPNPDAPYVDQVVLVTIVYGVKGKEYGRDHGDKIGPEGIIRVPLSLADKLHEYRSRERPKALSKWVKRGETLAEQRALRNEAVHLFLDQHDGARITAQSLYDTWRSVDRPAGWSPHLARDHWACSLLWKRMQQQKELLQFALNVKVDDTTLQALKSNALAVIQLEIQPQLRHVSHETTMIYLQWLSDRLAVNLHAAHEVELEGEVDEDDE